MNLILTCSRTDSFSLMMWGRWFFLIRTDQKPVFVQGVEFVCVFWAESSAIKYFNSSGIK